MATENELAALRRRQSYYIAQFTRLEKKLDDIEQSGCPKEIDLLHIKDRLEAYEKEFRALQYQIVTLDEGEIARGSELEEEYERLHLRVFKQLIKTRRSTPSQSASGESTVGRESASLKLPEEQTRGLEIREQYNDRCDRLKRNQRTARQPRSSRPAHDGSATDVKLPRNALNQPSSHDPLDRKEVNPIQDNKDQPPPTETIAITRMAIPSHTTRSSARDTHNVSPTRDLTTTTFPSSASQPSDSTSQNVLNQSITRDSLDRTKLNLVQDDNGRISPTEIIAPAQMAIPSHTTRSSPRDIHNMSTVCDLTTTFAASASQSSDSTSHNVLNQSITQDPLDQKELILFQDDNGRTPPTEGTASTPAPIPSHTTRSSPRDIRTISTARDLTTTFAASASQSSDSTLHNVLNQSIARNSLDRKKLNPVQDDNGRTPPTEGTASSPAPISSHTTRSSPRDIRNISITRDLTTTFATSASQPFDSTPQNVSNQPNAPDLQDRKELKHVQDKNGYTPPTENTTLHVTHDMDIISESLSPGPNVKNSSSPWPRIATPRSDPNRNNLQVITTMTNHLIVGSFQNAPADLNTCPLSPQITTSDKSLILCFADCWTTPVQLPAISEKAQYGWINGGSLVPQSAMTSSTLPQPKRERGCPNDMKYFHGSDIAEIPYKKGETCPKSYHETIYDTWDKITQLGQIIGGSSVPQSNTKLCDVFDPIPWATGVSFNDISWGALFKDTSWAEVFLDTSWAKQFHDTSWIVNFNGLSTQQRTRLQDRQISSSHPLFGRIIEFTLPTMASLKRTRHHPHT